MKVLITGANGFIAKNLRSHLELDDSFEILTLTREHSESELSELVGAADAIFHLAGVNRPESDDEFIAGNTELTERIIAALKESGSRAPLLVTSSAQATLDNPYGRSKLSAENAVLEWHESSGAPALIYRLPGVFGKWSRPNYNSVVATFCHNLAQGLPLEVSNPDHLLKLVYIDDVVAEFAGMLQTAPDLLDSGFHEVPRTFELTLAELKARLEAIHAIRSSLVVPDVGDLLNKFLYATYTSFLSEDAFAYELKKSTDARGWLSEFVKSEHFGQIFVSKTKPGISRGNHWHKTKIEKFLVVAGEGEISFRNKIDEQDIIRFRVSGDDARVLDIPVGYVHAITNVGESDLVTIFWASEILDPNNPDTFFEAVVE